MLIANGIDIVGSFQVVHNVLKRTYHLFERMMIGLKWTPHFFVKTITVERLERELQFFFSLLFLPYITGTLTRNMVMQ